MDRVVVLEMKPGAGDLRERLQPHLEAERLASARELWVYLVALLSLPVGVSAVWPAALPASAVMVADSLWGGAVLVVALTLVAEWRWHLRQHAGTPREGLHSVPERGSTLASPGAVPGRWPGPTGAA